MRVPGRRAGGRRLQTRSSPSAAWRIKHRGIFHKGENMPIMAVLRTGGERDTDGQRGGIQVSKRHDQGREQHKAITIL